MSFDFGQDLAGLVWDGNMRIRKPRRNNRGLLYGDSDNLWALWKGKEYRVVSKDNESWSIWQLHSFGNEPYIEPYIEGGEDYRLVPVNPCKREIILPVTTTSVLLIGKRIIVSNGFGIYEMDKGKIRDTEHKILGLAEYTDHHEEKKLCYTTRKGLIRDAMTDEVVSSTKVLEDEVLYVATLGSNDNYKVQDRQVKDFSNFLVAPRLKDVNALAVHDGKLLAGTASCTIYDVLNDKPYHEAIAPVTNMLSVDGRAMGRLRKWMEEI